MPPRAPAISVVIPVYNGARYLRAAIESVCAQTTAAAEIIVVDDGSTDGTGQLALTYPNLKYIWQAHTGAGAARNRGAAAATGDLLAFLDADDLWIPEKLSLQVAALQSSPETDMVFGWIEEFVTPDLPSAEAARLRPRPDPLRGPSSITLLTNRVNFVQSGGFPTDLKLGEFVSWYLRVIEQKWRPLMLPQVLARRRLHAGNQGRTNHDHRSQFGLIAKQALERKRRAASP